MVITFCAGIFSRADIQSMLSEVVKMSELSHPNIMSVVGVCVDSSQGPSIVMPYMANGSLLDYLKRERESLYLDFDAETDTVSIIARCLQKWCAYNIIGPVCEKIVTENESPNITGYGLSCLAEDSPQRLGCKKLHVRNAIYTWFQLAIYQISLRLNSKGIIKVADFGLSEDIYTASYFRQNKDDPVKLPFKWMAPESLSDGLFNQKTDVVHTFFCLGTLS